MSVSLRFNTIQLLLLLFACALLSFPANAQKVNKDLFLLIGQSNMAGRGILENNPPHVNSKIWMIDRNNVWVPAKDPIHFDKPTAVGVGPGLSFAQMVSESEYGKEIGLIPCAVGGSGIDDWQKGAQHSQTGIFAYDAMLSRVRTAKKDGKLKAILWHQGEQDSSKEKVVVYEEKLIRFFKQLRKDLKAKKTPIIIGTLGDFYTEKNPIAGEVNQIITALPSKIKNVYVVFAQGLEHKGDQVHFSTEAQKEFGKRYAKKYLSVTNK